MNDVTLLVSQLLGPISLALGLGMFVTPGFYRNIYKHIGDGGAGVLVGAIVAIAVGILIVLNHDRWSTTPEIVVTLLGWAMIVKGAALAIMPKMFGELAHNASNSLKIIGVVMVVLGGYLSYIAYLD